MSDFIDLLPDKTENLNTTSRKFKRDLAEFLSEKNLYTAVEMGTHRGYTTRVLSQYVGKVYTIDSSEEFMSNAKETNKDRDNITYILHNLYGMPVKSIKIPEPVDLVFIDAGHEYGQVWTDIERGMTFTPSSEVYYVFDDYGHPWAAVKQVVDEAIKNGQLEFVKHIGSPVGTNFGGKPERILKDYEGIVCKLNKEF